MKGKISTQTIQDNNSVGHEKKTVWYNNSDKNPTVVGLSSNYNLQERTFYEITGSYSILSVG